MLVAAHEQGRKGQHEEGGALGLFAQGCRGAVAHRGRAVAPQPHARRRFPLALAHEERVGLGRAAPVDALGRIARLVAAELPEGVPTPHPAAAMHPLGYRGGNALRAYEEGGQGRGQPLGPLLGRLRTLLGGALCHLRAGSDQVQTA